MISMYHNYGILYSYNSIIFNLYSMSSCTPRQSSDLFISKKECREALDQEPTCYQYGPVSQYHVDPPLHPYLVKGDGEMKFRPGWVSFFFKISFSGERGAVQGKNAL